MVGVLYLASAILIVYLVFLPFQAVGGRLFGAKISEIGLFNSPALFRFSLGGIVFKLNALPFGSYVKFTDEFESLSPFKKILILLSGALSYLAIGFVGLGFTETFRQIFSGFSQLFSGLFSPLVIGAAYLEAIIEIMLQNSFLFGLGIIACKMFAFNLFPLGGLISGNLLIYILEIFGVKSEKFVEKFNLLGILFILIFHIAYAAAFVALVLNRIKYN